LGDELAAISTLRLFRPSLWNIFALGYFLDRTLNWYVGGFYAYTPIIILTILGAFLILDYGDRYNRLLLDWMPISSAMAFVDFPWQIRFLYLTPFYIYISLGIPPQCRTTLQNLQDKKRMCSYNNFWNFYSLSILLLTNYTARCITIKPLGLQINLKKDYPIIFYF